MKHALAQSRPVVALTALGSVFVLAGCQQESVALDPVPPAPLAIYDSEPVQFDAPIEPADTYGYGAPQPAAYNATPAAATYDPAPTPVPAPAAARTHVVRDGDTLWDLAVAYYGSGLRWEDIAAANPGVNPQRMQIGEELIIP